MPERLNLAIAVVTNLLLHGQRLLTVVARQIDQPQFSTIAAAAGTHDPDIVFARIQRGVFRLTALFAYLMERAKKGRELPITQPRTHAPAPRSDKPRPEEPAKELRPRRTPYDPDSRNISVLVDFDKEVRRTPVGRSIARACLDLAVIPGFCTSDFWDALLETLQSHGSSLNALYKIRMKRETTFKRQRDKRPETWSWDWRDRRRPIIRQVLGYLIGDPPTPDPLPAA